jgi:hypothetical protein
MRARAYVRLYARTDDKANTRVIILLAERTCTSVGRDAFVAHTKTRVIKSPSS